MLVFKKWVHFYKHGTIVNGNYSMWKGCFLFGIIPLYMVREKNRFEVVCDYLYPNKSDIQQ